MCKCGINGGKHLFKDCHNVLESDFGIKQVTHRLLFVSKLRGLLHCNRHSGLGRPWNQRRRSCGDRVSRRNKALMLEACVREASVEGSHHSVDGTIDPAPDRAVPETPTVVGVGRKPVPTSSWVRAVT